MERIPRKWEYIVSELEKLNAPIEIIDAAKKIDYILLTRGLGWNTYAWEHFCTYKINIYELLDLVTNMEYCSACVDAEQECRTCKLTLLGQKCVDFNKNTPSLFEEVYDWIEHECNSFDYFK